MAIGKLTIAAAALVVIAIGASAARHPESGRGLKQSVAVSAPSPAVSLDISAGPFGGFLNRMVSFLQSDANMLRANVASTASAINSTVAENPLVATFETNLASGLEAAQHNLNTALENGQLARQGALANLNTVFNNLLTGGNSILQNAEAALPPMPTLPAGLALPSGLPIIGQPVSTVQTSG